MNGGMGTTISRRVFNSFKMDCSYDQPSQNDVACFARGWVLLTAQGLTWAADKAVLRPRVGTRSDRGVPAP